MEAVRGAFKKAKLSQMMDLQACDYIETNCNLTQKYSQRRVDMLTDDERERLPSLRLLLKNTGLHYLNQVRLRQKHNSIVAIAYLASELNTKRREQEQQKKKEIQGMALLQKLENMEFSIKKVKPTNFNKIERQSSLLGQELNNNHKEVNKLT